MEFLLHQGLLGGRWRRPAATVRGNADRRSRCLRCANRGLFGLRTDEIEGAGWTISRSRRRSTPLSPGWVSVRPRDLVSCIRTGAALPDGHRDEAATLAATVAAPMPRIEIVSDRRRAHSAEFRAAMVAQSLEPGIRIQELARRNGICASLIYRGGGSNRPLRLRSVGSGSDRFGDRAGRRSRSRRRE